VTSSHPYDAHYFAHACGVPYRRDEHWLGFFSAIADRIVAELGPRSVLDAGCGMGFLVEALRERGVEAYGVDVSEYAIGQVHESVRDYCWTGSITDPFPARYDLITCIEVLEHLPGDRGGAAIENLCRHCGDVLFSSTPNDFEEPTHANVRPPEYWVEEFGRRGFFRDVDFDASFVTPWARRFRPSSEPVHRIVAAYERRLWQQEQEARGSRSAAAAQRAAVAAQEGELAALRAHVTALEMEQDRLAARLADTDALAEQLLSSASWRITAPLRTLKARIHGRESSGGEDRPRKVG
jgi:SAM-dependent methyltransferase